MSQVSQTRVVSPQLNKDKLHLVSCGYLREYCISRNTNPKDIAQIIAMFLYVGWTFDYCYEKAGSDHGIYENGKTVKCDSLACFCFYRVSYGMVPNSGIYNIKFKIDRIRSDNIYKCNAIGMTCNTDDTNNSVSGGKYWYCSHDYIAWSTFDHDNQLQDHQNLPNGLLCGYAKTYQDNNIFIKSKFIYKSNNQHYKQGLPPVKPNDTIILQYDSNNNSLSFFKSNNDKLNSSIINLPKGKTFYWIVGHSTREMSVTIVE